MIEFPLSVKGNMGNFAAKSEVLAKTEQVREQESSLAAKDEQLLKTLEEKAALIDQKLAEYEKRVVNAPDTSSESSKVLSARYISELKELRKVLVDAEKEQNSLLERITELETAKSKLEYQVKHLKRALQ